MNVFPTKASSLTVINISTLKARVKLAITDATDSINIIVLGNEADRIHCLPA